MTFNDPTFGVSATEADGTGFGVDVERISIELERTVVRPDDAVLPKWGVRLGLVLLLPEK